MRRYRWIKRFLSLVLIIALSLNTCLGINNIYAEEGETGQVIAPVLSEASYDRTGIVLEWSEIEGVSGYNLYRMEESSGRYVLLANITDAVNYTDTEAVYGVKYSYRINAYTIVDNALEYTGLSNTVSAIREVGKVTEMAITSDETGKTVMTWKGCKYVDGYNIYISYSDSLGTIEEMLLYDSITLNGEESDTFEWVDDTSDMEPGIKVTYYVRAYVEEGYTEIQGEPVEAEITLNHKPDEESKVYVENIWWYVKDDSLYLDWDEYESDEEYGGYIITLYESLEDDAKGEVVVQENSAIIPWPEEYQINYVTVQVIDKDSNKITYAQNPPVYVGAKVESIELDDLEDVELQLNESTTLEAVITDEIDNFVYTYQWYVSKSEDEEGEAVPDAGARMITVSSAEECELYYYCVVTGQYNGQVIGRTNMAKVTVKEPKVSIEDCDIEVEEDCIYTGEEQEVAVQVYYEGDCLAENIDYILEYSDNIEAGDATVTVTGIGDYEGSVDVTFVIAPRTLQSSWISDIPDQMYDGVSILPDFEIYDGEVLLEPDEDYYFTCEDNDQIGIATIIIYGMGNYQGEIEINFNIIENEKEEIPDRLSSTVYDINQDTDVISKITVGTTVADLLKDIKEKEYAVVYSGDTVSVGTDILKTGMVICLAADDEIVRKYTIIVTGDTNGDGKINITDMMAVKAHVMKKSLLSGYNQMAGDVNGDGKINITDFIAVKAHTLKKSSIQGVAVK